MRTKGMAARGRAEEWTAQAPTANAPAEVLFDPPSALRRGAADGVRSERFPSRAVVGVAAVVGGLTLIWPQDVLLLSKIAFFYVMSTR